VTASFDAGGPAPCEARAGVPLAIAGAVAATATLWVRPPSVAAAGLALVAVLFVIAVIDRRSFVIPDALVAVGLAVAFVSAAIESSAPLVQTIGLAALRGMGMALAFYAFRAAYRWARGREGMGLGDVKLAAVAGVSLQAATLPYVVEVAAAFGVGFVFWSRATGRHAVEAATPLPFGAFLAPAIWVCWFAERFYA
jgi:leader peptidase (prepilin peptidase) / N-methyltransferase